jgi:hypothetical protein
MYNNQKTENRTWIRVKSDDMKKLDREEVRATLASLQEKLAPAGVSMKTWAKP